MKLFISYRSSDHREVDYIAKQLRSIKDENGSAKYTTWQDKHDLDAGKSWWDGIIEAIIDCDIFVFHLSPEYLQSKMCMAELNYAVERNRPIIPVVLDSAYYITPRTKRPKIDFWDDIPDWLGNYQFLFFDNEDFLERFERAVAKFETNWPQDIDVRPPMNPNDNSVHGSTFAVYASATDYAIRLAFDDAKPLFRELVTRNDAHFANICRQWLILLDKYQELLEAKEHRAPRVVFKDLWDAYTARFPLDFIDDLYPDAHESVIIFDPKNLAKAPFYCKKKAQPPTHLKDVTIFQPDKPKQATSKVITETPKSEQKTKAQSRPTVISTNKPSEMLLPKPFDWIEIPKKGYSIAKYPVTNAQFAKFIEAGGYNTERWWTKEGWQKRAEGWHYDSEWKASSTPWTEPRYWNDSQWNAAEQPVVGISWFEAVAFCLWLSEATGEKVMLPTEDQYQYAAQGDDSRTYPWGNDWDSSKCQNSVDSEAGKTSLVTQYEGKGDSPFDAVDMAGNVWEWCLTDYNEKTNNFNSFAKSRVLRGGSWLKFYTDCFRCDSRSFGYPHVWNGDYGFRLSRS